MYKNILFPIDISEAGSWDESLPVVQDLAKSFGATVHVVTVISGGSMSLVQQYLPKFSLEKMLDRTNLALKEFTKEHLSDNGIKTQCIVAKGSVYESIIKTADKINADLIVMSAHRAELKDYLLGPNSAKVVRHSKRSVLVVRDNNS